ncbi:MAG: hypothetical protein ACK4S2_09970 [Gemmobacter sp.]|jgi:hypothetical protein|uniref:hypothetical protein n=1 Tax=Gemmobacter sp. TaxID=1898957 RepID=UPI003918DA48
MFIIAGFLSGALWGGYLARRRKGAPLDVAQYAAAFSIAFGILGLFATVLLDKFA